MYDNNGNIVKKREFAKVSLKEGLLLEEEDSKDTAYVYEGDRLVSYGGVALTEGYRYLVVLSKLLF